MWKHSVFAYIFVMAVVTYLIRMIPLVFFRKEISNQFVRSFLHFVPYVTLSVMTFPAMITATSSTIAAGVSFVIAVILAYKGANLFQVSIGACTVVFLLELFL